MRPLRLCEKCASLRSDSRKGAKGAVENALTISLNSSLKIKSCGGSVDGSLTSGEAAKIERDEAKIQRDEARAKADGGVTARERARLNRELNHTSREIYRDKHNRRRR